MNKKLMDQPDHGHYPYCLVRKRQIENDAVKILAVTAVSGLIMLLCVFLGVPLGIITRLARFVSGGSYIAFLFIGWLEVLLLPLFAVLNFFRSKIYGIVLQGIYFLLAVSVLNGCTRSPEALIPLFIGVAGIIVTKRAIPDLADQRQLEITEGYPLFSEIYTEQTKNPDYKSRYEDIRNPGVLRKSDRSDTNMRAVSSGESKRDLIGAKSVTAEMNDLFAPAEISQEDHTSPKTEPETPPMPEQAEETPPLPEKETKPETSGVEYIKKYDPGILESSTSLFDDDYELPSIKPLYFQRLEEEKKKKHQE